MCNSDYWRLHTAPHVSVCMHASMPMLPPRASTVAWNLHVPEAEEPHLNSPAHTNLSKPARHILSPLTLSLIRHPHCRLPERDHGHSAAIQMCISAPGLCQGAKGASQYAVILQTPVLLSKAVAPNLLSSSTYTSQWIVLKMSITKWAQLLVLLVTCVHVNCTLYSCNRTYRARYIRMKWTKMW